MPSIRTQIYLTDTQRQRIDELADSTGITMAEVIRRAVDSYLSEQSPESATALSSTFGTVADLEVPDRDEWARG